MKKQDGLSIVIILALAVIGVVVWREILFFTPPTSPSLTFLDVGQGDATLLTLPNGIQILTDAGPSRQILSSLGRAARGDRYIDLAIISHSQLDHYNGFNYLLQNYEFGAFLWNGRGAESEEWKILMSKIEEKKIPFIVVEAGDRVRYGDSVIEIISPNNLSIQSAEPNDTGIVELVKTPPFRALLTADIGENIEKYLMQNFNLRADVLKVGHHGSKYSSSDEFLREVSPRVAVIEVDSSNRYGHPTKEALERLAASGAKIFRTDQNGTVEIFVENQKLKIFTER